MLDPVAACDAAGAQRRERDDELDLGCTMDRHDPPAIVRARNVSGEFVEVGRSRLVEVDLERADRDPLGGVPGAERETAGEQDALR